MNAQDHRTFIRVREITYETYRIVSSASVRDKDEEEEEGGGGMTQDIRKRDKGSGWVGQYSETRAACWGVRGKSEETGWVTDIDRVGTGRVGLL